MEVSRDVNIWEKIVKNSLDVICTINKQGIYVNVNEAFWRILGYESREVVGQHYARFLHPDDLASTGRIAEDIQRGSRVSNFENRGIHKNGQEVWMLWSAVWSEDDDVMVCVGRDISTQKISRRKEEFQKILAEYGADTLAVFDEKLNYIHSGGSIFKQMGYTPEQLVGTSLLDYIHPDDLPVVKESLAKAVSSRNDFVVSNLRFRNAKGEWRWIESTVSNQLHNPAVQAIVTTSRDVTEMVNHKVWLEESQQRFKSLFDYHADMIFIQNRDGVIIDVNAAALAVHGVEKDFFLNRDLSHILPPELVHVHKQMLEKALNGEPVRAEIELPIQGRGMASIDILKIPVVVKGETIGTFSILKDVTEIRNSNNLIRRQAEKLNNIMESITDAFCTLDKNWIFTYVNTEFERLFRTDRNSLLGRNLWEMDMGKLREAFQKQFYGAVETGKSANFEIYLEELDMFLNVKAFPSAESLSIFINDITASVKAKQELQKLSLVASKTTNGVIIKNANGAIEWVNEGFTSLTGYTLSEATGKIAASLLSGGETNEATTKRFQEKRKQGLPYQGELLIYNKSGEQLWVLVNSTPILNEAGEVVKYITIQTDITDRKEAEASQLLLTKDLYRQNQDLQQFTYIVSHNLRAPVANAMGLVELLAVTDKESETFNTSLGYLKKSVYQLDGVLRDLNMILSIRDKKDSIDGERIQLVQICKQAIEDFRESLNTSGAEVSLAIEESIYVHGDKAYLYSVFYNLLSNAIKYRSPKRLLKISINSISNTESGKIISFSDNGSGFDMNLAGDKVFRLYKRFHTGSEGRGIGLFLVKAHLNAMGGNIEVTSQVNVGTRFLIYFK
ncbi:PAS domain S-box protein [Cesiribacter sp. SM1]|uniref:PAS domain-containing sensor histidine kinase n=1 Tax=Cesiribacter sp. SM1 TaxID=2861196 RepID=UPI001CD75670|nr:PAS domain S-box protein [Cesiribacter sp. SM1]